MFTHISKKVITVFLLFSFLGSETVHANPEFANPLRFDPEKPRAFHLDIPPGLGKVEEFYLPPGEKDFPFVVHIQAVHAHFETARKIREMIRHLEKNYGVNQILAEGASEKLHPEYLNFVPDSKLNQKIINALAEKGELTGVDYALPDSGLEAWGIEEPGLYRRALGIFKKVIGGREQAEALLNEKRLALDREASRFFDKDLRELVSCWLKFNAAQKGMLEVFRFLRGQAKAEMNLDFENAFSQYDWPQLTRLALLQELEKRESAAEFKKEKEKLAAWLKALNISEDFSAYLEAESAADPEDGRAGDSPRKRAEAFLEKTVSHGFRFSDYPQITYRAAAKVLQSEMQSKALFEEFDRLFNRLLVLRAEKPEEQKFVEEYRALVFLEKLFRLELTPDDWEKVKQKGIGKEEETGRQALRFYRLMEKRDAVFQAEIQKRFSGTSRKAVLVTGGFHAKGLKAFFEKNRIGYALITPQISGPIDSSLYYQIMTRSSSLEQTLFTQDPRVSMEKQGWDVAAQRENVIQVHRQQKVEMDPAAPYFAAAASLGQKSALQKPAAENLRDYRYDPELGRDQKAFLVVKNFRQQAFTKGQILGKRSGIMGGSDVRKYVPGLVAEIDLSTDRIEANSVKKSLPLTEPMGIDRRDKRVAVTAGDRVRIYDFEHQTMQEYTYPWFASLHTVQFSADGERLLVTSTGFDAVFEIELKTARISWEWFAWDHGYNRSVLGYEVTRDAGRVARLRDSGEEIIADRWRLLSVPSPIGAKLKTVAVLNPADWKNKDGLIYGLPAKFRPEHLNGARYGNDGRVFLTFFHSGKVIAVDPKTNRVQKTLNGFENPHGLMQWNDQELLVTDTMNGRFFVIDGNFRPRREISVAGMPGVIRSEDAPEWLQNTIPLANGILAAIDMHRSKLWLIDINSRSYRGIDLPQDWASQEILPLPENWETYGTAVFSHVRTEVFPPYERQALAGSLGQEGRRRDPYGNLPGNFRKDGREKIYNRLYTALAKKELSHELSGFFANSFARQSDKALDRLVGWGFLKPAERAVIESGGGKLDYPRLASRIKRLHDTYLKHGFSPAQAKLMVFRFVPYPIAKGLMKKYLSVKSIFVDVVKRHSDFPDFFARAAKAKESFPEETGLAETLLWQVLLRQGLEASPETGGLPKAEWWIRQAKAVVDSFGEVRGLNASLKWQIAARQGIERAAGISKPKALEWFDRAKQVVEAIPDAKGLNPTFKWEIVIGQGVEKAVETDGLPRARWWFDKTLAKVEHAIQLGTAPSTAWSRAIKQAASLGTEQEPDAALVTWQDQYREMLQTAGGPEEAQARYDAFYRQIREIFRQTFHRDDMLDDLVRAYVASDKPSLPIAVNSKIILQAVAVYLLIKSLSEPFWESDLAVVRDMIDDYNRLTDPIVPLSVPSLFKTALSPHYKDSELYVRLSRQLKRLPGDDGVWALALNLFATGAHLSILSTDRTDDFDHSLEDAEFAIQLLKGEGLSPETREALEVGLGRFLYFLVPFEFGRIVKPKIFDPAGTLPDRIQGFIQRHALFISALIEDKDPQARFVRQFGRDRYSPVKDIASQDYFLVGLEWFLYQRVEPLIFDQAPRSNVPMEKIFLSRSDPAAAEYLTGRMNHVFSRNLDGRRSRTMLSYDPMISLIVRNEFKKNISQVLAQSLGESEGRKPESWGQRILRRAWEYRAARRSAYYDRQLDSAERYLEAVNFFSGDKPAIRRLRQAMDEETMLTGHQEYIAMAQNALDAAPDDKLNAEQKERKAVLVKRAEDYSVLVAGALDKVRKSGPSAESLGDERGPAAYTLEDEEFDLRSVLPQETRIEQVVILADNTGTLTINFETPLGEGMIQSLYGFLARPGGRTSAEKYSLVINSGDARQGVVSAHAPLIRRLADEPRAAPFLNDYYFTTDGGKYTFHLNESAGEVSLGQIPDWAVQDRVERSLAIAEAFYDEVAERMAHGPENLTPLLKDLTPEALARDRELAEQTIRAKAATDETWTSIPAGEVKNTVVCFLQEFFGKRVFVYDSGSKIAVESAQLSAQEQFPYDFYQGLERRVRQKFGGDAAPFLTFTGTQFLDLTQVSKLEAVLGILHQRVFPLLDTTKPTLFVVIGDGGNDIPTLTHDFPEIPNSLRIPVFLSHHASFAGQLQGLWVSRAEKVAGGQEVVDWVNSIQGKLVSDTASLKLKKWLESGQSLGAAPPADDSSWVELLEDIDVRLRDMVSDEAGVRGVIGRDDKQHAVTAAYQRQDREAEITVTLDPSNLKMTITGWTNLPVGEGGIQIQAFDSENRPVAGVEATAARYRFTAEAHLKGNWAEARKGAMDALRLVLTDLRNHFYFDKGDAPLEFSPAMDETIPQFGLPTGRELVEFYGQHDARGWARRPSGAWVPLGMMLLSPEILQWYLGLINDFGRNLNILSLGSGRGDLEKALIKAGHKVTAVDISPLNAAYAKKAGVETLVADAHDALTFKDKFDLVILVDSIGQMDPKVVIVRTKDYLKDGGSVFITTPRTKAAMTFDEYANSKYLRYPRAYINQLLEQTGFEITSGGLLPIGQGADPAEVTLEYHSARLQAQSLGAAQRKPVFSENISGLELPMLYGDGKALMPLAAEVGGGAVSPFALIGGIFTAGIGPDIKEYPVFLERVAARGALMEKSREEIARAVKALEDKSLDGAGIDREAPVAFLVMLKALKEGDRAGLRARLADLAPGSVVIGYDDRYAPSGLDLGSMLPAGIQYSRVVYEKTLSLKRVKEDQARAAGKDTPLAGHSVFLFSGFQDLVSEAGDAEQDLKQIGTAFQLNAELLREQPRVLQSRIIPAIAGETLQFAKLDREAREQVLAQNRESGLLGFADGAYAFELDLWMDARASQIISSAA